MSRIRRYFDTGLSNPKATVGTIYLFGIVPLVRGIYCPYLPDRETGMRQRVRGFIRWAVVLRWREPRRPGWKS